MNFSELKDKLQQLDIEDFIWLVYIGIIFLSWYSNSLERNYFLTNNLSSKNNYRKIMIMIFTILMLVYFYFLNDSYKSFKDLKPWDDEKKKMLVSLSFIASLLIAVSGVIFLFIAISDKEMNVELAFN